MKSIDTNDKYTIYTAVIIHIYHVVFFFKYLTYNEWFHHCLMIGVSGALSILYPSKIIVMGIWFMSGFPGMIDYFLLWMVKMGWMESITEKYIYTIITMFLRSPGCILVFFTAIPHLNNPTMSRKYISLFLNALLTLWNGQYYAMITCVDYGSRLKNIAHYNVQ
ncbi:MAG TPA: hypothetical protein EYO58_00200 [Flavobacteriales bacterium]|nr:hypothetical protein [Flavobacteriales bacterium]